MLQRLYGGKMKKNKDNNMTVFIVVAGLVVLIVFTSVIAYNFISNHESDSYYAKVDEEMTAKIENVEIVDGKLNLLTIGDPIAFCVKSTRTKPTLNSLCWNALENNKASINIFSYKKYYVWIKDSEGNISEATSVKGR